MWCDQWNIETIFVGKIKLIYNNEHFASTFSLDFTSKVDIIKLRIGIIRRGIPVMWRDRFVLCYLFDLDEYITNKLLFISIFHFKSSSFYLTISYC